MVGASRESCQRSQSTNQLAGSYSSVDASIPSPGIRLPQGRGRPAGAWQYVRVREPHSWVG